MPGVPPALKDPLRQIAARPGASAAGALLLALGIALTTAMFSAVDALVIRPVPFPQADRLVQIGIGARDRGIVSAWRASGFFDAVEMARESLFESGTRGASWPGAFVTPGTFDLLGARPLLGRLFARAADGSPPANEILLSEGLWRWQFLADPGVIGHHIDVDGVPLTIVGILPDDFRFPMPSTMAWRPLDSGAPDAGIHRIMGRLREGLSPASVTAPIMAMTRAAARDRDAYISPLRGVGPAVLPPATQRALWLLLAGVICVFAVLCANASSLFLTQLAKRRRDLAIRSALGASRTTLVRNAVIEQACIAVAAIGLGALLAAAVLRLLPPGLLGGSLNPIDLDRRALAAASALGLAALLLAGLVPALLAGHARIVDGMRLAATTTTAARGARRTSQMFVVVQVAVACCLLVGSGLLIKSFANLTRADKGLDVDGVVRVTISLPSRAFDGPARMLTNDAILTAFASLPSATSVALSQEVPPGPTPTGGGQVRSHPDDPFVPSDGYRVGPGFFRVYGIPIVRGRGLDDGAADDEVVISERLASRLWAGEDPLGRRFSIGVLPGTRRVVGVAREIIVPALDPALERPEFYQPMQRDARVSYLSVRCAPTCPGEAAIRERLTAIDPDITVRGIAASEAAYLRHLTIPKLLAELAGLFGICALVTAGAGIFTIVAHAASTRRRELGIRAALGASSMDLARTIAGSVAVMTAAGLAAGVAGGWLLGRALGSFQYGVAPGDPAVWLGVPGATAAACVLAAWLPARRAMRTDPAVVLKDA